MGHRLFVLCSAFAGAAAVGAGIAALAVTGQAAVWTVNASWTLGGVAALSGTLAAAVRVERNRVGWAWRLWAAATALWLVGVLVVDVLTLFDVASWLAVEAIWTVATLVAIVGLAMRSAPDWLSFRLFVLDALPVAFLVAGVTLAVAGGRADAAFWPFLLLSSAVYALVLMISVQIVIWLASRAANMYLVSGGISLAAVTGISWWMRGDAEAMQAHWSSGLLTAGFLIVALVGFRRAAEPRRYTVLQPLDREHAARSVPGAAAVIALIVATGVAGDHFLVLALAAACAFALRSYLVRRSSIEAHRELARLIQLDPLTGLLNRRGLQDALVREHERSRRDGSGSFVTLLVDIDDFKLVNLELGYGGGDVVLRDVGRILQTSVRPTDHVARIGGDEFLLLLLPGASSQEGLRAAERIRHGIADQAESGRSAEVGVTASVGVVPASPETRSLDELIALADTGLLRSKQAGKNRSSLLDGGSPVSVPGSLEELCRGGRLYAVAQPIVRVSDGALRGYELLSRSTVDGYELPEDFFPLCDRGGKLTAIDVECFQICVEAVDWSDESLRYHFNLFPSTLVDVSAERVVASLPEDRARRACCIELSARHIAGDPTYLLESVRTLKEAGFQLAVDDVGFGRSYLESLLLLEPDLIKVDPALVRGISGNLSRQLSLSRLLAVACALGAEVVAEGVESEIDLAVVRRLGVTYGQGHVLGRIRELRPGGERPDEPGLGRLAVGS